MISADITPSRSVVEADARPPGAGELALPLFIEGSAPVGTPQPLSVGVPFPKGALTDPASLALFDAEDHPVVLQTSVLARWPDESIKWLLVDFVVSAGQSAGTWNLRQQQHGPATEGQPKLRVADSQQGSIVETGAATFLLTHTALPPVYAVSVGHMPIMEPGSLRVVLTDREGRRHSPRFGRMVVETRGPVRMTVRVEGTFARASGLRIVARCCFFAGTGLLRLRLTLHNANAAKHPGGLWDLGDRGSIFFKAMALELRLSGAQTPRIIWSPEPDAAPQSSAEAVEIYQDSSGGENWRSRNHLNRFGQVPCAFRGYRVRAGPAHSDGLRASPWISAQGESANVTAAVPEFWQQFPKALEGDGSTLRVGLFPRQWSDDFELQGGEQKTQTIWLHFGADPSPASALAWVHEPLAVRADPQWYMSAGVLPFIAPPVGALQEGLERLIQSAVRGERSLQRRREVIDEYGWRNYGDHYADHESAYQADDSLLISHYNNQYDLLFGCVLQYLRTGDAAWFSLLDPLARHVIDIDIYHTAHDRAAYSGGAFWHTDHYRDAASSTHRSFSRANARPGRAYGGGPSNEHNYTTGLLFFHYLTGDPLARESVIGLADWVIRCDDGSRTLLGIVDERPTGLASRTCESSFHGPGRGAGNSINALLDAWLLSGRARYLEVAEKLIRRTINPGDDVASLALLDAERRWSYTVYLIALARYLELKAQAGLLDSMYGYARASLVRYAQWMLDHEVSYLDHAERLEYPNEAWPAQDFRKANVLRLAARHAGSALTSPLLRRADEIADRAWRDLQKFRGIDSIRVLALLMVEGLRDASLRASPPELSDPGRHHTFPPPEPFVPQRRRVMTQMRSIRGLMAAAGRAANPARWRTYWYARQKNAAEMRLARDGPVVCHVLHSLGIGGAEVMAARLARQLRGSFCFTFVCLDELGTLGEELRAEDFLIHTLGRRPGVDLRCSQRLARFMREQNVDLLHCHLYSPFFYGICARLLCRRPPVLFTEHGREYPDFPRRKRIAANRALLQRRDRVICVGQAVKQALIINEGIAAKRIAIIANGIELESFAASRHSRASVRKELNLESDDLVLLQVARLDPIKDHVTALRMLAHLLTQCPRARLILAGEGPERQSIARHIAELGIGRQVRMLGLRSDVSHLLAAADIALLTSVSEGIPLALIEAMAAGLPVIATDVGGVSEVVEDRVTGFLAPPAEPAALAGKVLMLADDPQLRTRMGEAGRVRAHERFSETRMLAEYRRLYEEMLDG